MSNEAWVKIGKGALLAGAGAGAVYGLQAVDVVDWGEYDVMIASAISVLINVVRKWVAR